MTDLQERIIRAVVAIREGEDRNGEIICQVRIFDGDCSVALSEEARADGNMHYLPLAELAAALAVAERRA